MLRSLAPLVLLTALAAGTTGDQQEGVSERSTGGGQEATHEQAGRRQHHATQDTSRQVGDYQHYVTQYAGEYQQQYQGHTRSYSGGSAAHTSGGAPAVESVDDARAWEDAFMQKYADSYKHYKDAGKRLARRFPSAPASSAECHSMAALNEWRAAQRAVIDVFVPEDYQSFPEKQVDKEYQENRARIHSELAQVSNHTRTRSEGAPTEEPAKKDPEPRGDAPGKDEPAAPAVDLAASQAAFTTWLRGTADAKLVKASSRNNASATGASRGRSGGPPGQKQPAEEHKSRSELRHEDEEERREERREDEAQRRKARHEDEQNRREERREDEAQRREARHQDDQERNEDESHRHEARQEDKKERREERREDEEERREDDEERSEERREDDEKRSGERRQDNEKRSKERRQDNEKRSEERRKDDGKRSQEHREDAGKHQGAPAPKAQHDDSEEAGEEPPKGEASGQQKRPAGTAPAPPEPQPRGPTPEPADLPTQPALMAGLAGTAASSSAGLAGLAALAAATALSASVVAMIPWLRLGARGDVTFTERLLDAEAPLPAV